MSNQVGLVAQGAAVPLQGVVVEADIVGLSAQVTITQRYRNLESQPIEAVYVFPLDEGAAVCGFEAIAADVHYVGQVLERDEAFERYDQAIHDGHGAYLLDEERPDVFTASLGAIPPGSEVLLKLTYVAEVPLEGDALRFTLPTTVSPRYAPREDQTGLGRPDAETLNPPVAWKVPYGLDLTVRFDLPAPITRLESPSHPVSVSFAGTSAVVRLAQDQAPLDRDFVLLAAPAGLDAPTVIVERDEDGRHAVLVAFRPMFAASTAASEIVFLVDSVRLDGRLLDRAGPQRAAAAPPLAHPRLPFQHRRVRLDLRQPVPGEPRVRRGQPRRRKQARRIARRRFRRHGTPARTGVRPVAPASR